VNRYWQEIFGTGIVKERRGLRDHGRRAQPSRAARLARGRIPRELGREEARSGSWSRPRPTGSRPSRRRTSSRRIRRTGSCRAAPGSAWTPRWSGTTR
jgi:hypothetical protein